MPALRAGAAGIWSRIMGKLVLAAATLGFESVFSEERSAVETSGSEHNVAPMLAQPA